MAAPEESACDYDLCVVGGGINGAGIARDAAGRCLKVLLLERGDLGCATSSASTKLIHGGLRYLEYGQFRLVREALRERATLLKIAPHIVHPMEFILPHDPQMRPAWMIRTGLFLYDHLAGRGGLAPSRAVDLAEDTAGKPLSPVYDRGFVYSDASVDDARLVVLNAVDAAEHGADIRTRAACTGLEPIKGGRGWRVSFTEKGREGETKTARVVVNATGPWVRSFLESPGLVAPDLPRIRLVKGSHIVVPKLFNGSHAYIFQQPDRRIVFAIPYLENFTLVGTTEESFSGDPAQAKISQAETEYLCRAVGRAFCAEMKPENIVWSYSGVRPLAEEDSGKSATAASRDYRIVSQTHDGNALHSIFGGKITTYRALAEEAVDRIFGEKGRWTADMPLPGGAIGPEGFEAFLMRQKRKYPGLAPERAGRLAHAYGTRMDVFLANEKGGGDPARLVAPGLSVAEIRYLKEREFARTAEDILWRRSKLGLTAPPESAAEIDAILKNL